MSIATCRLISVRGVHFCGISSGWSHSRNRNNRCCCQDLGCEVSGRKVLHPFPICHHARSFIYLPSGFTVVCLMSDQIWWPCWCCYGCLRMASSQKEKPPLLTPISLAVCLCLLVLVLGVSPVVSWWIAMVVVADLYVGWSGSQSRGWYQRIERSDSHFSPHLRTLRWNTPFVFASGWVLFGRTWISEFLMWELFYFWRCFVLQWGILLWLLIWGTIRCFRVYQVASVKSEWNCINTLPDFPGTGSFPLPDFSLTLRPQLDLLCRAWSWFIDCHVDFSCFCIRAGKATCIKFGPAVEVHSTRITW